MNQYLTLLAPQDFNSIKVRLELRRLSQIQLALLNFNSIKVRLEQFIVMNKSVLNPYFNSIKVRLEPSCSSCHSPVYPISIP